MANGVGRKQRRSKEDCWHDLANTIIIQTDNDYISGWNGQSEQRQIEKFFKSEYFGALTSIDPDYLLNHLRAMKK